MMRQTIQPISSNQIQFLKSRESQINIFEHLCDKKLYVKGILAKNCYVCNNKIGRLHRKRHCEFCG